MNATLIDIATWPFWAALGVAILLVAPLARDQHKSWTFALLNLAFIGVVANWQTAVIVFIGTVVAWFLAIAIRQTRRRTPAFLAALAGALALFLLHKRPDWFAALHSLQALNPILRVVAYSYITLRLVELFRAMYEERYDPPNLQSTINYLIPFHMLAAGPIQSYDDFVTQPGEPRPMTPAVVLSAFQRIAHGVFKKFVIAFIVQKMFLTNFSVPGFYWIIEAQMFFIWLYIDFSAYSDIAVGVGRLIGVATPENFMRPYFARNIINFWERWHISLSMWIRRNLFFPVQVGLLRRTGGKHPLLCASAGFIVAFLLCGMWHDIAWAFFVWGCMHASGLIIVNLYRNFLNKKLSSKGVKAYLANPYIKAVSMAITFEWVAISHLTFFARFGNEISAFFVHISGGML
jgi:D-alanyl-lipoteichoic acid acyltransferase DltB (MBOAT superfamily)